MFGMIIYVHRKTVVTFRILYSFIGNSIFQTFYFKSQKLYNYFL